MRSCATCWFSLLSSWSSLWLLFGWKGRRGRRWNVIVSAFNFIVITLICGHLWRHCWSIILYRWHWIVGRWGGHGRSCKGIWQANKKLLLRWKCWVVERWLMESWLEWHVRLIPISEQLGRMNTWWMKRLLFKWVNLRIRPDMMLIVRLCSLLWHIILFSKYVLILDECIGVM